MWESIAVTTEIVIRASGLSKAYRIYRNPTDRLRQAIVPRLRRLASPLLRLLGRSTQSTPYFTEFWALRELSFEVTRGETVAIIGRNGSGKSTLLQLVCGTLTPSAGDVQVQGRVAALLELGSGFNPEYTGRENVFLNASVLGLTREETAERLDAILAFADIGAFIDQPTKTYSSGMAMRLAFAVIAHVDADILIVDEALSVGDMMFSQKCLRWLREFQSHGTVLFCSHDTGAVMQLCQRAIWLDQGRVRMQGAAADVAKAYLTEAASHAMGLGAPANVEIGPVSATERAGLLSTEGRESYGSGQAVITHMGLVRADGLAISMLSGGEELVVIVRTEAKVPLGQIIFGFVVKDRLGQTVTGSNTLQLRDFDLQLGQGDTVHVRLPFTLPMLGNGDYVVSCSVGSGSQANNIQHHWVHDCASFQVSRMNWEGALVRSDLGTVTVERELAPG